MAVDWDKAREEYDDWDNMSQLEKDNLLECPDSPYYFTSTRDKVIFILFMLVLFIGLGVRIVMAF